MILSHVFKTVRMCCKFVAVKLLPIVTKHLILMYISYDGDQVFSFNLKYFMQTIQLHFTVSLPLRLTAQRGIAHCKKIAMEEKKI
jgi:hypothetical protein